MENSVSPLKTIFIFLTILWFQANHIEAQSTGQLLLPKEEVDALQEIGDQLGKTDWDFNLNPCDGNSNWNTSRRPGMPNYNNSIICDCSSFPAGVCHVTKIFLRGQDLDGVLPPSLAKLLFLTAIDLARNYLSGTIPSEWTLLSNLEYMSVLVNHLSRPIPDYLGNMTKLKVLNLENNMFTGTIPAALGNMTNLENLILSTNNLTGEMPTELSKLTKLTELRLSSNNLTGKLILFDSWTNLQMLEIQGCGLEGPIPSNIALFKNLTELRISDLKGGGSAFPSLSNMTGMHRLMLRNCNLSGGIPDYIAQMGNLQTLDLSFNNLEGVVPSLQGLLDLEIMYLTGNSLSGPVPDWIKNMNSKHQIDLSYNNFTENSQPSTCGDTLNLYRSFGMKAHSKMSKCLKPCSKDYYEVHINCGGKRTKAGNVFFEADDNSAAGNANLYMPTEYWGSSNTGDFWGRNRSPTDYTATNISVLNVKDSALYTTARLSALSLAYYGRCLANGYYTVTLNFAEIIFRDDRSFQTLGKRMFDVYIQDERKLQDFNIENSAGGVDKVATQQFKAVPVNDGVLEIRFQFAGKGSTAVPIRGTYGPLISAISIQFDFKSPSNANGKVRIALSSAASVIFVILIVGIAAWKIHSKNKISREKDNTAKSNRKNKAKNNVEQQIREFTYAEIKKMTKDFANRIGKGGYGEVFLGSMSNCTQVAVKRLLTQSADAGKDFMAEIKVLKVASHPNLTPFFGYCKDKDMALVFKYMPNGNLHQILSSGSPNILTWRQRLSIAFDAAKGLLYLHEELNHIHRDIKPENILLDENFEANLADFGLVKEISADATHVSTMYKGTLGYLDPEYWNTHHLRRASDVYSFGVVLSRLITGRPASFKEVNESEYFTNVSVWIKNNKENDCLRETVVDPKLNGNFDRKTAEKALNLAIACTSPKYAGRPSMRQVVKELEECLKLIDANEEIHVLHQSNGTLDNNGYNDSIQEIVDDLTVSVGQGSRISSCSFTLR